MFKRFIRKKGVLILLALLTLNSFYVSAKDETIKNVEQYLPLLEPEENHILTKSTQEIIFNKSGDKVSAEMSVSKQYTSVRYGDYYATQVAYDNESNKIYSEVVTAPRIGIRHSSNTTSDGIFYDGYNICTLSFNTINKGDIATISYKLNYPEMFYLSRVLFAEDLFTLNKVVKITIPSWLNMEIKEFNFNSTIKKSVMNKKNETIYTYSMDNMKAYKSENRSRSISWNQPSLLFVYKSANISKNKEVEFFPTAQKQYEWYQSLIAQNVEITDSLCAETKQITAKCKTDKEKLTTVYEWVQSNIRYIAFEDGMAGYRPQIAHEVFDNKYGDCKGMANLLCKMLGCVGIDARLTWLGTNDIPYDYSTPSLAVDNHAICAAILGKDTIYLDATNQYLPVGVYPSSIEGRPAMVSNGVNCILTRIPEVSPKQNTDSVSIKFAIDQNKLKGTLKNTFKGDNKTRFLSLLEDNDNELMSTLHSSGFIGLPEKERNIKVSSLSASDSTISIEYPFEDRSDLILADGKYYLSMDLWQNMIYGDVDIEKRTTDLFLKNKKVYSYVAELEIPANYTVSYKPANKNIDNPNFSFNTQYIIKGNKLTYKRNLTIKNPLIKKEQFKEWNNDIKQIKASYLEQVVLSKTADKKQVSKSKKNNKK